MKFVFLFFLLISSCTSIKLDPSVPSSLANDLTALVDGSELQGCGTQLQSGLLFCRVSEGQAVTEKIYFVAPPVKCKRDDACVFIKVYFPNGEPALEVAIPKGQTEIGIPWQDIIKAESFKKDQRGFWGFKRKMYFTIDGVDHENIDEGLIYLRVISYESLHESKDNPYFVWTFESRGSVVKMTTSGRTYVGKHN